MLNNIIFPDWDAPDNIKAIQTTRLEGFSHAPFDSFNLAEHVNDNTSDVIKNRQKLVELLPAEPKWLNQIHSNTVVDANVSMPGMDADGSYTTQANVVSVVMTADCLPVLICDRNGKGVAAIHAGWRGLLDGILEQGVTKLLDAIHGKPQDLLIWLGPAIGPDRFEVGDEVRQAFLDKTPPKSSDYLKIAQCFIPSTHETDVAMKRKWLADIYQLAQVRLSAIGVENFFGGTYCTYKGNNRFYSYRREGKTGRMASLIWIE